MSDNAKSPIPESIPVALEPVHTTPTINQPIKLYEGKLRLDQKGKEFNGIGSIQLIWLPTPELRFELREYTSRKLVELGDASLHVLNAHQPFEVRVTVRQLSGGQDAKPPPVSGTLTKTAEIGHADTLASLLLHIPNFRDYRGSTVRNEARTSAWAARAILEAEDWQVAIDRLRTSDRKSMDDLKNASGYAITHVGKLERTDGQPFSANDAKDLMESLFYFLSFCRGIWVPPALAVGFDTNGNRVWEEWRNWKIERWRRVASWFNDFTSEGLVKGFPGFWSRWRETSWHEPVRLALHWYIESNMCAGGMEGSIILTQAAFELLAWTLLVEDRKVLSEDGFQKLPASDKLRLLISTCKVPLAIPGSLADLADVAKSYDWQNGPQALTEMRNALVHAVPKKRKKVLGTDVKARYDAWSLGLWYLELVLLSLFDYSGSYSNRLRRDCWRGQEVEQVPWA